VWVKEQTMRNIETGALVKVENVGLGMVIDMTPVEKCKGKAAKYRVLLGRSLSKWIRSSLLQVQ
jgi:hypothetical protein